MTEHTCLTPPAGDPVAARLGLGAAALAYQRMGYTVLPLARAAKKPHSMLGHEGGVHHATRDPAWAWYWWSQDRAAGIGVATGAASGLVVIDLDVKGMHNGPHELRYFLQQNGLGLPGQGLLDGDDGLPVAYTPSGGQHLYFRTPAPRLMVTGSRTWTDERTIAWALSLYWQARVRILVHGASPGGGADLIAARIWESWGGTCEPHPPARGSGVAGLFARNTEMAASGPLACLAFAMPCSKDGCPQRGQHGTHGTEHAIAEARAHGVLTFRLPGDTIMVQKLGVPQRLGILPGVDVKGDGGYVVAAPTMIWQPTLDGEPVLLPYSWAAGCPCSVPMAPEWLFSWVASTPPAPVGGGAGTSGGPAVDLAGLRETGLAEGTRNAGLYRLACSLYARYGTGPAGQAAVAEQIRPVLDRTSSKDFGHREIATILASARQFVAASRERDMEQTEAARRWLTR